MHFTIEKEVFLKGLSRVQAIVEKRNTIPILSNVLIEATSENLILTATDLEVGMRAFYPASIKTPGKVTVSAKKIYEIIKELPEKEISFKTKENCWVEIRCGKSLFNIVGLSPEEFPVFPNPEEATFFSLEAATLKKMIESTFFSISTDETKYNLNGIFFSTSDSASVNHLRMVATDGHRLALIEKKIDASEITKLTEGIIFPKKGIYELRKLSEEGDGTLNLGFRDNNAIVTRDNTTVVMRLVDGEFPDYKRVIPTQNEYSAVIPREPFLHALRRMSILSSEKSRGVKIAIRSGILELSSSNPDLGEAKEDLEILYEGPDLSVGFNARYLMDILQALDQERIRFSLKDNLSPGLIQPEDNDDFLAVVMPMRL